MRHYITMLSLVATTLLSTIAVSAQPAASASQHSAITPAPREGGWMNRHNSFNEKVQAHQNNIDLAFIGDSITQGWEGRGKIVWETYYGHRKALNLGIGGDRTQHVLWRLDNGNVEGIAPKVAVLMIGTNNSADDRNTAPEMVDGVRAVVKKIRTKLPQTKILLLAIFPRGHEFNDRRGKILQVNQAISRLHDGEFVHYLDIGKHFLTDNGILSPSIMPDFLHLSTAGYGIWAEAIEGFIAAHLGDSPVKVDHSEVAGDWSFEIEGPDGPVEASMTIAANGAALSGSVDMGGRNLPFKAGGRFKNKVSIQIVRERPQGGSMTYNLVGTVKGDSIEGEVSAKMGEENVTIPWLAERR